MPQDHGGAPGIFHRSNTTTQTNASARLANATTSKAPFVAFANATRKPEIKADTLIKPNTTETDFDLPSGWAELWRLERNGKYGNWVIRFIEERITRPAGRLTEAHQKILAARPGRGRHAASRADAARLRSRAIALAKRI